MLIGLVCKNYYACGLHESAKSCRWDNQNGFDSNQPRSFAPYFDDNNRHGIWMFPIALAAGAGAEWKSWHG
jgi:hypothetical protein